MVSGWVVAPARLSGAVRELGPALAIAGKNTGGSISRRSGLFLRSAGLLLPALGSGPHGGDRRRYFGGRRSATIRGGDGGRRGGPVRSGGTIPDGLCALVLESLHGGRGPKRAGIIAARIVHTGGEVRLPGSGVFIRELAPGRGPKLLMLPAGPCLLLSGGVGTLATASLVLHPVLLVTLVR
ncbi:hypothetical protein [Roseomonas chloroacetimidivorans]|uniref:hypothetical protein n=1 Tax=Roseomonas chloroacetimidivorans TaxID=1766656 RepID=UPI003C783465